MKKSEVLKTLKKLEKILVENQKGSELVLELTSIVNELPSNFFQSVKSEFNSSLDDLTLPKELEGMTSAYALFSDGACRGNPGPGSWASVIQNAKGEIIFKSSGVDVPTTNNKMELQGVIRALSGLIDKWIEDGISDRVSPVFVYSDSKYVIDGITSWVQGWKNRGWKKADGKNPENMDLWKELDELNANFQTIKYIWVKGHAGHPQNEMCDQLCNQALDEAGF